TNHTYFNLAGHASGSTEIYAHSIKINANDITETDADSIPTGQLTAVQGTPFDLRATGNLGERLKKLLPARGYDDNYCVELINNGITVIGKAFHPGSGRWLEIASNQPGVQFYTSNFMPDVTEPPIEGKSGAKYHKHGAFCLETQKYPDAVNHPNFPSIILNPGEKYNHEVIYKFGVCRHCEAEPE
ncbi:galactose mutarotase-like, partial [Teleopsis dalmanni]|uniref:galactose mutarotase-like n=1 Tax=Teleopsis dalmanni TaxID=139649 RepID=UPI0018CE490F